MGEQARILRLLIASPSDVSRERDVVAVVVDDLNKSVCADRDLRMEVIRWETDAYPGFHPQGPQGLIDPILRIEDCDVLVGIFWKRFGTPTGDAGSGTEHEIRRALAAWRKSGRPQVMVYFNQKPYTPKSKEETDQWGQVLGFQDAFPREGLWWPYRGASRFDQLLRRQLTNFIRNSFPIGRPESAKSSPAPRPTHPATAGNAYFSVQAKIIQENTRTFAGRVHAQRAFEDFRNRNGCGYFLVRGGPGQGKTALSCQLVKKGQYLHHFISRTGGRAETRLILRSLLAQLEPPDGGGTANLESVSELTKAFEEALPRAARQGNGIVIVVDALDELPDLASDPPYLPVEVPEGVFMVVTSRPGEPLDRLQQRLFAVPSELYELGPLELAEMRDILSSRRPGITDPEIERIAEASQGNPLYLRAVADQLEANPRYDLSELPSSIEGFFRDATRSLSMGNAALGEVLGLLSVARKPLSLRDLSRVTGAQQRVIYETAIRPVQQFLFETEGGYTFYHARFHEFVRRAILYEDELREAHRKIADWLETPEGRDSRYRLDSLAHHLYEAGASERLIEVIDETFLTEAARRLGYAVLESLELLTRALLERREPALIERCVALVESLQRVVGGDIVAEVANTLQPYRSGPQAFRTQLIEPRLPDTAGMDIYVGMLPKAEVPADFFELVPLEQRLFAAIGDAPSVGLKSAFVARFIGNVFRDFVIRGSYRDLGSLLAAVDTMINGYDYFRRISMQCIAVDPKRGIVRMANAGHPYPAHFSARSGKCDILPLTGDVLHSSVPGLQVPSSFEEYAIQAGAGDMVVMVTDGLTEAHVLKGDPYGYRFTSIIEKLAPDGAKAVGEAILGAWRAHAREADVGDDVTVIAIKIEMAEEGHSP